MSYKVMLVAPIVDAKYGTLWPPVGLAYLATAVRRGGHDVAIVDCYRDCRTTADFARRVRDYQPDIVGFTVYTSSIRAALELISAAKAECPRCRVIVGGPHISALPERALSDLPGADFAIRGEGEIPLRMLVDGAPHATVPGLIYQGPGGLEMNPSIFAPDLEDYGQPAWDLLPLAEYYKGGALPIPVFTSRGCPFPCTFCAAKVTSGQRLRVRSMDSIFAELRWMWDTHGIRKFIIWDEGFGSSKDTMLAFCERALRDGFQGAFQCGPGLRLDQIDSELLTALARAGFDRRIALGIESGSERILKLMRKRSSLALIREKVSLLDSMGFQPCGYFILGYPSETREEMEATVRLALDLPFRLASFMPFLPLPGTEATRHLIESGELPPDFDFSQIVVSAVPYAPKGMSLAELQSIRRRALMRFWLRPKILLPALKSWTWRDAWYWGRRALKVLFRDQTEQASPTGAVRRQQAAGR